MPRKDETVFNKCKACHSVDEPKNKVGPNLVGVFGRPAGTVEGFKYSEAMKGFGHHLGRDDPWPRTSPIRAATSKATAWRSLA